MSSQSHALKPSYYYSIDRLACRRVDTINMAECLLYIGDTRRAKYKRGGDEDNLPPHWRWSLTRPAHRWALQQQHRQACRPKIIFLSFSFRKRAISYVLYCSCHSYHARNATNHHNQLYPVDDYSSKPTIYHLPASIINHLKGQKKRIEKRWHKLALAPTICTTYKLKDSQYRWAICESPVTIIRHVVRYVLVHELSLAAVL